MAQMRKLLRLLRDSRFKYKPLLEVEVFKKNLQHNLHVAREKIAVAPVLKSNAYGHGIVNVAQIMEQEKVPFLIVDSYYEALILRNEKIKSEILMMGHNDVENIINNKLKNVVFGIVGIETLRELSALKKTQKFHLKIDTGMNRQGISLEQIDEAIDLIKSNKNIIPEGIFSHFADSDGETEDFSLLQIEKWNEIVKKFRSEFDLKYWHLSNSFGLKFAEKIDANVLRLGIGLYLGEKPALQLKSKISSIKSVKAGAKIGYNCTFEAPQDMKIATLPLGYFEGVDRRLSNCGFVKIKGEFCPIVGRVSMNITTVDVSHVDAKAGDEVIVISANKDDKNSVENIAKTCRTIPYDILVHIPSQLRRVSR